MATTLICTVKSLSLYVCLFFFLPNIFTGNLVRNWPFTSYIPAASSSSFSVSHHLVRGYRVLLFEVDICIIRLGCVIVCALPPSEGAPEERGCCPAQQWRTPLCHHPTSPAPASHTPTSQVGYCASLGLALCSEEEEEECCDGSGRAGGWAEIFKHAEDELALRG